MRFQLLMRLARLRNTYCPVLVAVAVRHLLTGDGASDGVPEQEHLDVNAVTPG
jgi:hypothetical protein